MRRIFIICAVGLPLSLSASAKANWNIKCERERPQAMVCYACELTYETAKKGCLQKCGPTVLRRAVVTGAENTNCAPGTFSRRISPFRR